ncbi:FA complementation group M [Tachypleus tridentatus]|uniref:FA complementation group M n=1 Tax=Tachypleus tridentatus TaxID=6853 RepID=UPI003FD621E0
MNKKQATLFQTWSLSQVGKSDPVFRNMTGKGNCRIDTNVRTNSSSTSTRNTFNTSEVWNDCFVIESDDENDEALVQAMEESLFEYKKDSYVSCDNQASESNNKTNACDMESSSVYFEVKRKGCSFGSDLTCNLVESIDDSENNENFVQAGVNTKQIPSCTPLESLPGFDTEAGKTWIYPTNYPVRDYQFKIVQEALLKNTLVILPTGLGKTFIAAVVMYNFYRWYPSSNIVFMAPTRPLVAQQIEACFKIMGIPQEDTVEMTGSMLPQERKLAWEAKRVFFLTPQVMMNDLSRGVCLISKVKCIVVDEAHKALGNHSYCQVIKELMNCSKQFRVLALTASPGSDLMAVGKVLKNLLIAHVEMRADDSPDVVPYTHERIIQKIVVPLGEEVKYFQNLFLSVINTYLRRLNQQGALTCTNPSSLSKFKMLKLRESFKQNPHHRIPHNLHGFIHANFSLCITLYHAYELLLLHGMTSFFNFLQGVISGEKSQARVKTELMKNAEFVKMMESLRNKLQNVTVEDSLQSCNAKSDSCRNLFQETVKDSEMHASLNSIGHPKLTKLKEIVIEHFKKRQSEAGDGNPVDTRVMIFSQYRDSVNEITALLNLQRPLIKAMSFIGQTSTNKNSKGFTQKQQTKIIKDFRDGGYNTLVATCVGEEGLDIGEVDLIVCFDAPKSPIRLIQRMGRTGRKRQGRIVVLVTEGKEEQAYNQSRYSKKTIHKAIISGRAFQSLYSHNPRMVPKEINPVCHKMFMTVDTYKAQNGNTQKRFLKDVCQKKFLVSKNGKLNSVNSNSILNAEELLFWNTHLKLPNNDIPVLDASSSFVTLPVAANNILGYQKTRKTLSLSEWMPWQNVKQQTYFVEHSSKTQNLVEIMKFMELQGQIGSNNDLYGLEMKVYLRPDDVLQPGEKNEFSSKITMFVKTDGRNVAQKCEQKLESEPKHETFSAFVGQNCKKKKLMQNTLQRKTKQKSKVKQIEENSGTKEDKKQQDKNSMKPVRHLTIVIDDEDEDFKVPMKQLQDQAELSNNSKSRSDRGEQCTSYMKEHVPDIEPVLVNPCQEETFVDNTEMLENMAYSCVNNTYSIDKESNPVFVSKVKEPPSLGDNIFSPGKSSLSPVNLDEIVAINNFMIQKVQMSENSSKDLGVSKEVSLVSECSQHEKFPPKTVVQNEKCFLKEGTSVLSNDQKLFDFNYKVYVSSAEKVGEFPLKVSGVINSESVATNVNKNNFSPAVLNKENVKGINGMMITPESKNDPFIFLSEPGCSSKDVTDINNKLKYTRRNGYVGNSTPEFSGEDSVYMNSKPEYSRRNILDDDKPECMGENISDNLLKQRCTKETTTDVNNKQDYKTKGASGMLGKQVETNSSNVLKWLEVKTDPYVIHEQKEKNITNMLSKLQEKDIFKLGENQTPDLLNKSQDSISTEVLHKDKSFQCYTGNVPSSPLIANHSQTENGLTMTQLISFLNSSELATQEVFSPPRIHQVNEGDIVKVLVHTESKCKNFQTFMINFTNISEAEKTSPAKNIEYCRDSVEHSDSCLKNEHESKENKSVFKSECADFDLMFDLDDLDVLNDIEEEMIPPSPLVSCSTSNAPKQERKQLSLNRNGTCRKLYSSSDVNEGTPSVPHLIKDEKTCVQRNGKKLDQLPHSQGFSFENLTVENDRNMTCKDSFTCCEDVSKNKSMCIKDTMSTNFTEIQNANTEGNVLPSSSPIIGVVKPIHRSPSKSPSFSPIIAQDQPSDNDSVVIQRYRKRVHNVINSSPSSSEDGSLSNCQTPFKQEKIHSQDSDDFVSSKPCKGFRVSCKVNSLNTHSTSDVKAARLLPTKEGQKNKFSRQRECLEFLDLEAQVSDEENENSEAEIEDSILDEYESSFIDDLEDNKISQQQVGKNDDSTHIMYLRSIKSPIGRQGQYKLRYNLNADVDVFSQISSPNHSEYIEDSFCVANDCIEYETSPFIPKPRTLKRPQLLKKRRIVMMDVSSEEVEKEKIPPALPEKFDRNNQLETINDLKTTSDNTEYSETFEVISKMSTTFGSDLQQNVLSHQSKCVSTSLQSDVKLSKPSNSKTQKTFLKDYPDSFNDTKEFELNHETKFLSYSVNEDGPVMKDNLNLQNFVPKINISGSCNDGLMVDQLICSNNKLKTLPNPNTVISFQEELRKQRLLRQKQKREEFLKKLKEKKDSSACTYQKTVSNTTGTISKELQRESDTTVMFNKKSFQVVSEDSGQTVTLDNTRKPEVTPWDVHFDSSLNKKSTFISPAFNQQSTINNVLPNNSLEHVSSLKQTVCDLSAQKIKTAGNFTVPSVTGLMDSVYNSVKHETKLVILVDSREISSGHLVMSCLRSKYKCKTVVQQLVHADYLVSNRLGVHRIVLPEFANGQNRSKLLETVRTMCDLYDRPCLIIEKEKVKQDKKPKNFYRTKYFDNTLSQLVQTHVKVIHSDSQEETASLLFDLAQQEHRKGWDLPLVPGSTLKVEQVLQFYLTIPCVSYATALNFFYSFSSIKHFMESSRDKLQQAGKISQAKATEIYRYLRRTIE